MAFKHTCIVAIAGFAALFLFSQLSYGQEGLSSSGATVKNEEEHQKIYHTVSDRPEAPYDVNRHIAENLTYPEEAIAGKIQGKVWVQFVVNEDGSISDITIQRGKELGGGLPAEALRVVKTLQSLPKWKPARNHGEPVKVYYIVPVSFAFE